LLANQ
jgi:hypothetical protein